MPRKNFIGEDTLPDKSMTEIVEMFQNNDSKEIQKFKDAHNEAVAISMHETRQTPLDIDRFNLDEELCKQPNAMAQACEIVACSKAWLDFVTNAMKSFESAYSGLLRVEAEKAGEKVVESKLDKMCADHMAFHVLRQMKSDWIAQTARADGLREALLQRSSALSKLVTLWEGEYFSTDTKVQKRKK